MMPAEASNADTAATTADSAANAHVSRAPVAETNETNRPEAGNEMGTTEDATAPTVPDGGWGWMVVLGSFMIQLIVCGIVRSFSKFYIDFLLFFESSFGATFLLSHVMYGVSCVSGNVGLRTVMKGKSKGDPILEIERKRPQPIPLLICGQQGRH